MTGAHDASKDRAERLHALLQSCLQAISAGTAPDLQEIVRQNPEFAGELTAFFADRTGQKQVTQVVVRPGRMEPDATLPPGSLAADDSGFTLSSESNGADPEATLPPEPDTESLMLPNVTRKFGDYELLEEIARGGMGVVFKARQISINRLVALKMILAGQLASEAQVQRFHTEAKAAGNLDHPNIVPIYEVNQHEGHFFFSMKLVEGCSLAQLLTDMRNEGRKTKGGSEAKNGQASSLSVLLTAHQRDSARLIADVARAIHHAHQRGILHRDLKPANILLQMKGTRSGTPGDARDHASLGGSRASPDPSVPRQSSVSTPRATQAPPPGSSPMRSAIPMVTDFGLAKQVEEDDGLTQSGTIVGTPSYMAPEQARAEKGLTTATDVYSLGAILFEMLTGRPPFLAATSVQTVLHVLEKEPDAPRSLNPHIDRDLETVCLKCLEKDPRKRYGSAEELAQDLDRWLAGEPILARPVSGSERLWRWCRRKPLVAGLVLAVLLSLVGGIGVSTYFAFEASNRAADAEWQKKRADEKADLAEQEKERADQKTELANDYLARSLFDQAQTLRRSNKPGRRADGLLKLLEAEKLCSRVPLVQSRVKAPKTSPGLSAKLPTSLELRNEAVALLLAQDARLVGEIKPASNSAVFLSPDGLLAAWAWYDLKKDRQLKNEAEGSKEGCEVTDLATGKSVRWETPLTSAHAFQGAIRPDKKVVVSLKTGTEQLEFRDLWNGKIVTVLNKALDWPLDKDSEPIGIALSPSLTFSPDGRYLAGVRKSFKRLEIALWDLKNDRSKVFSREHTFRIAWVVFSATGKLIAFPSGEKTVTLWDLESDIKAVDIDLPQASTGPPAFGPDDRLIAFPCRNKDDNKPNVIVWDTTIKSDTSSKNVRFRFPLSQAVVGKTLAFRPGTNVLAIGDGANIVLVDALQGKEMFRFETGNAVTQFAWQPDGNHLVSFGPKDTIKIWELSERPPLFSMLPAVERFSDMEFSADGRWLALLGADTPRIWLVDRKTGKVERDFVTKVTKPTQETFGGMLIRRDGKQVAAHGWIEQDSPPTVRVWDVASGKEVSILRQADTFLHSLAFGPDNHVYVAVGTQGMLAVWDVTLSRRVWSDTSVSVGSGSLLSSDARYLVSYPVNVGARRQFSLWEIASGREHGPFPLEGIPNQLVFSRDGSLLAIHHRAIDPGKGNVGQSGLSVWSVPSGALLHSWQDLAGQQLAFSPDNKMLAVLMIDRFIKLLDVQTGEEIFTWQTSARDVAFTPDGAFLATIVPTGTSTEAGAAVQFLDLANLRQSLGRMNLDWRK